mgnify:CR=1 FL=1
MKHYCLANTNLSLSRLAYGCMGLGGPMDRSALDSAQRRLARSAVTTATEAGINLFDHADIYALGKAEQVFGEIIGSSPALRDTITLQSKCGIRIPGMPGIEGMPDTLAPKRYDFSFDHLVGSVEAILLRLRTDYLDILLLHRPDPLADPDEVARALEHLYASGKVRHFGVSNHTGFQIELLRSRTDRPLLINQLQISLAHSGVIDDGLSVNSAPVGVAGTLDYCRLHGMLVQAWAPLAGGRLSDPRHAPDDTTRRTADLVARIAQAHECSREAIILAWLLRHPAGIQPIIGTTRPERIAACCEADAVRLSREDWYRLYESAKGREVP